MFENGLEFWKMHSVDILTKFYTVLIFFCVCVFGIVNWFT